MKRKLSLVKDFNLREVSLKSANWEGLVAQSFKETGFAIIKDHDIPKDMIEAFYFQWEAFFNSNKKEEYKTQNGISGFFPFKSENAKNNNFKDLKEFYHVFYPFNNVPAGVSGITTQSLSFKLLEIARNILWKLQPYIPKDLSKIQVEPLHLMVKDSPSNLLRILHYPALKDEDFKTGEVRAAAHEDINLITLLLSATQPGLEVLDLKGNWHKVECEPNSLIVNVGDMLQEASGGIFKSTTHKVVNPSNNEPRYSIPLFVHPKPGTRLSSRYTAQEYLDERLKELGLKK